ncbi:MAG: HAD family hydrolase [Acidobacteriota bacterium]
MGTYTDPRRTQAVLFDLDDTLFDHRASTRCALRAVQAAFRVYQAWPITEFEHRHAVLLELLHVEVLAGRMSVDQARVERFGRLAIDAGGSEADPRAAEIARSYREAYVSSWKPVPGAREVLAMLHEQARIGIVTNNVVAEQRQKVDTCGFTPLVDAVVISEEIGVAKPDPRIFAACLERLGVDAGDAVMVGDSWPSDVLGARAAGLRAVWFNRSGAPAPDGSAITQLAALEPADAVTSVLLRAGLPTYAASVWGEGTP